MPFIVWVIIVIVVIVSGSKAKSAKGDNNKRKPDGNVNPTPQRANVNVKPNVQRPVMAERKEDVCGDSVHLNRRDTFSDEEHPKLEQGVGIIAGRSEDWHSPSVGNRIVTCHYCGAYNQVPARKDGMFKCYFCWRKL